MINNLPVRVAFTGHRNRTTYELELAAIAHCFPKAVWVHGGAKGFDSQVEDYAHKLGIKTHVIRPDYNRYGRGAPLIRNKEIVSGAKLLVACYDGRQTGGTFYTINFAKKHKIPVVIVSARESNDVW